MFTPLKKLTSSLDLGGKALNEHRCPERLPSANSTGMFCKLGLPIIII